jgi:transposase
MVEPFSLSTTRGSGLRLSNELDQNKLPTSELLNTYKDQNRSVERGFRFLKLRHEAS